MAHLKGDEMSKFKAWLNFAEPAEYFVYHEGPHPAGKYLYEVREAYNDGLVELVQERLAHAPNPHGVGRFEYRAVKRKDVRPIRNAEHRFSDVQCGKLKRCA